MAKHNKKRNVGLIHEQLIRYVASSLVAEDTESAETAVRIVAKHFKPGTELYKEFRLFNALVNMPVGTRSLAERVLSESKRAASSHNPQKLRQEKSLLIKDINTKLTESKRFYDIKIRNYKLFATVQSVLNEWRGRENLDLTTRAKYEETIVDWLARENAGLVQEAVETSPLIRNLMYQKFESKYSSQLSERQKNILEASILGDAADFITIVKSTKKQAISELQNLKMTSDNKMLKESIEEIKAKVCALPEEKNDAVISKTLHLVHLIEEMTTDGR